MLVPEPARPEPLPEQGRTLIDIEVHGFMVWAALARATAEVLRLEAELDEIAAARAAMERDAQAA